MSEKTRIIEGYQPSVRTVHDGYQPTASDQKGKEQNIPLSTPVAMVNVIPPQGGTGETSLKKE
jgi:hypothetical protein